MKKRSIIGIIFALFLCVSFTACRGLSNNEAVDTNADEWKEIQLDASNEVVRECCDKHLYGLDGVYVGMQNFVDELNIAAPDNKFTQKITELYNAIDMENATALEKDLFNTIITLVPQIEASENQIKLGKGWVVGYDNEKATTTDRLIVLETTEIFEDGSAEVIYSGCSTSEKDGKIVFWRQSSIDPKELTGIDITTDKGVCTYFEDEGIITEYSSISSDYVNNVFEKERALIDILKSYYVDIYYVPNKEYEEYLDKVQKEKKLKEIYGEDFYREHKEEIDEYWKYADL